MALAWPLCLSMAPAILPPILPIIAQSKLEVITVQCKPLLSLSLPQLSASPQISDRPNSTTLTTTTASLLPWPSQCPRSLPHGWQEQHLSLPSNLVVQASPSSKYLAFLCHSLCISSLDAKAHLASELHTLWPATSHCSLFPAPTAPMCAPVVFTLLQEVGFWASKRFETSMGDKKARQ